MGGLIPCTRPTVKKRKLDILKQGGLEVTAVTHTSVGSVTITAERQHSSCSSSSTSSSSSSSSPSSSATANTNYYRPSSSNDKQVCITVTPDLGHLLPPASIEPNYSPNSSSSSTSPMSNNQHTHPIQSRSIYEHSQVRTQISLLISLIAFPIIIFSSNSYYYFTFLGNFRH